MKRLQKILSKALIVALVFAEAATPLGGELISLSQSACAYREITNEENAKFKLLQRVSSVSASLKVNSIAPASSTGFAAFYIQNKGGNFDWFDAPDEKTVIDGEGTYEVVWSDVQSVITVTDGDKSKTKLLFPTAWWENIPEFGIQVGSDGITEEGDEGTVDTELTALTVTLIDGTELDLMPEDATISLAGDLVGKQEEWGLSGNCVIYKLNDALYEAYEAYFEKKHETPNVKISYTGIGQDTEYTCDVCWNTYNDSYTSKLELAKPSLTLNSRTSTAIRVKWTPSNDVDGYMIEQYKDGIWVRIGKVTNNSTSNFLVTGLTEATQYQFRMQTYKNEEGTVVKSNYSDILTTASNVLAPKGVRIAGRVKDAIRINWTINPKASGYIIEQKINGNWTRVGKTGKSSQTFRVGGLESKTAYEFRIQSYATIGSQTVKSGYVNINATTI